MYEDHRNCVRRPLDVSAPVARRNSGEASRLRVKQSRGWFPAGDGVRRARSLLSDGAFKLYISIALDADTGTGRYETTHQQLANLLGKSKRIIGVYIREVEAKGVCRVQPARNQHARTVLHVCDEYWPYLRGANPEPCEQNRGDNPYVSRIRNYFLGLGCVAGSFTPADERFACALQRRGVVPERAEEAMLMAAIRKFNAWLTKGPSEPIGTLCYIDSVISEIDRQPWPSGYREYLEMKLSQFKQLWAESGTRKPDQG